jgi:hypothetical protein
MSEASGSLVSLSMIWEGAHSVLDHFGADVWEMVAG